MLAAMTLMLVGIAITALGIVTSICYDIGVAVMMVAAVGLAVRLVDLARLFLAQRQS